MYEHEEKVIEVLVEVKEAVTKNDTVVAVQRIEEGMSLVKNRMKMIKVADRSQYGWSTVKKYEQDDLASNSEDEKRLTRSERQAERKVKALLAKRSGQMNKRFEQVPASRIEGQSSSPMGNSLAGGFLKGLQSLVSKKASGSNIIGPCFKISSPLFSSFVHELCVFDCSTLLGNNKMFAVYQIHLCSFFLFPALLMHFEHNTEVTKSQRNRRRQRRLQIFQKIFFYSKHEKLMQCSGFVSS